MPRESLIAAIFFSSSAVRADVEQNKIIDEVEKERFYETYEHYTKLGGNSYIHDKVESLKKAGKL